MPTTRAGQDMVTLEAIMEKLLENSRQQDEHASRQGEIARNLQASIQAVREDTGRQVSEVDDRITTLAGNVSERVVSLTERIERLEISRTSRPDISSTVTTSVVKPSPYDGQIAWEEYDTQFEIVAKINGWEPMEKAGFLAAMLRGQAISVLTGLRENERSDFECLRRALSLRFGKTGTSQLHYAQFRNRTQGAQEDLASLAHDIERLVRLAFQECPPEVQDKLACEQFMHAIADLDTKEKVLLAQPRTAKEAVIKALELEAIRDSLRTPKRVRSATVETSQIMSRLEALEELLKKNTAAKHTWSGRRDDQLRCWTCGKLGHRRAQCNEKKGGSDSSTSGNDI